MCNLDALTIILGYLLRQIFEFGFLEFQSYLFFSFFFLLMLDVQTYSRSIDYQFP
ncbi:hypothetical protein DAI22_08g189100 [Oryza sativa Japonica Group]|nr:hypothetical protein DAI22_08g189100 [Oryza sativa Japonica Group]